MRLLFIPAFLAFMTACSAASEPKHEGSVTETTQLAAVLMYADWCGSCKELDPKLKAVKERGEIPGVTYVVLDYTAKDDASLFAAADDAGVGQAIRGRFEGGVKTGLLILVDADTNMIVNEVTKTMSEDEISEMIRDAANTA